ncbi:transmembrane protein 43 homolog [Anopheles aquasalis]|uniref:transmembrane protein 43 homolog n=1 Tax=Anopheles aquasalis TaxID=42839 RepID=UPI00215B7302|nr:transmembrane protein 43 homolog [Anopheles aquasalis]
MRFVEVFQTCWLTTLFGALLFINGSVFLVWNEGRAIRILLSLDEALSDAFTVRADSPYEKQYEGRLVHLNGPMITGEPLTEPDYNIQVQAVKLKRRVQMYQWVEETVENRFGETVATVETDERSYFYNREWRDELVDSRSFYIRHGHHNPTAFPLDSTVHTSEHVYIGPYELGDSAKNRFQNFQEVTSDTRPEDPSVKLHSGLYYHSNDIWNPEVGDIRIQFAYAGLEGSYVTVVGKLEQGKIVPYESTHSRKVLLLELGEHNLHEIFRMEHHQQRLVTWGVRFAGWVMLFFAATCCTTIMEHLVRQHRLLRIFCPDATFNFHRNATFSFSVALVIVSIAWIAHRPWLGGGLLVAAMSPFLYCARGMMGNYQRVD